MVLILLIPAALTATFGRMVGNRRQGWSLYVAMLVMLVVAIGVGYGAEQNGSPAQKDAGLELAADGGHHGRQPGGQGAALRDRLLDRVGGGDHRRLERLGQLLPRLLHRNRRPGAAEHDRRSGEVVFGGVGSGLYGMLLLVLLAVFIAGLMVGRTPEYLGKKIESREVKLVLIGA